MRSLRFGWKVAVTTLVAGALAIAAPASAQAATWYRTASTTHNGYSWNSYKARIYPSAYPTAPTGYKAYSKKVTVKTSGGTTLATKVSSSLRGPGTYKAYSYFTYRKQVPYTAYKTTSETMPLDWSISACTVTSVTSTTDSWADYTLNCSGKLQSLNDEKWYAASWAAVEWTQYFDGGSAAYSVGSALTDTDLADVSVDGYVGTYQKAYTAYKNYYAYKYRWRYATVKKVVNYSTATYTEFKAIYAPFEGDNGDTLARVRAIVGSYGTRTDFTDYGDSVFYSYKWKTNTGGTLSVGFWNGRAYFKTWYS